MINLRGISLGETKPIFSVQPSHPYLFGQLTSALAALVGSGYDSCAPTVGRRLQGAA